MAAHHDQPRTAGGRFGSKPSAPSSRAAALGDVEVPSLDVLNAAAPLDRQVELGVYNKALHVDRIDGSHVRWSTDHTAWLLSTGARVDDAGYVEQAFGFMAAPVILANDDGRYDLDIDTFMAGGTMPDSTYRDALQRLTAHSPTGSARTAFLTAIINAPDQYAYRGLCDGVGALIGN